MKKVGIWIDKREARIIFIEYGKEHITSVESEIEEFNPTGGSGTRFKGGPQDVVQDSKFLNREKKQLAKFFDKVIAKIEDADKLVIFGPAEAGQKLHAELQENHATLYSKTGPVQKADVKTDNQLKAWVRDYYRSDD